MSICACTYLRYILSSGGPCRQRSEVLPGMCHFHCQAGTDFSSSDHQRLEKRIPESTPVNDSTPGWAGAGMLLISGARAQLLEHYSHVFF